MSANTQRITIHINSEIIPNISAPLIRSFVLQIIILFSLHSEIVSAKVTANNCSEIFSESQVNFKILIKRPMGLEDHLYGLSILEQAFKKNPISGVHISKLLLNEDGQLGYRIIPGSITLQSYLQNISVSEKEKQKALLNFIHRRDLIRSALKESFDISSKLSNVVNLGNYGEFTVYQDTIFEGKRKVGSFYLGIQSYSFNPKRDEVFINNPAYFRKGSTPRIQNIEPALSVNTKDAILKQIIVSQQEVASKLTAKQEAQKIKNKYHRKLSEDKNFQLMSNFIRGERSLIEFSILSDIIKYSHEVLLFKNTDLPRQYLKSFSPREIEQSYHQWNRNAFQRSRIQIENLKKFLSFLYTKLPNEFHQRFIRVSEVVLKLVAHEIHGEVMLEVLIKHLSVFSTADSFIRKLEREVSSMIEKLESFSEAISFQTHSKIPALSIVDFRLYSNLSELESSFDVLARKSDVSRKFVSEVDVAFTSSARGIPGYRILRSKDGIRFTPDVKQKVYAIGVQGALDFNGQHSKGRSRHSIATRYYAVLLPKGFTKKYGQQKADGRSISNENFLRKYSGTSKIFPVVFEKATAKKGQLHVNLTWNNIFIDGKLTSHAQFIRDHVIAVVEFNKDGEIIQFQN